MKKVFSSNLQVSKVWASQTQHEGKASNVFFTGPIIYSYGHHYEIAHYIDAPNGEKVCFVNSNGFSNSTAKHTNHVLGSIPKDILTFYVPFEISGGFWYREQYIKVDILPNIINKMMANINNLCNKQLTARVNSHYFNQAHSQMAKALHICELFNIEKPQLPLNWFDAENKSNEISYKNSQKQLN